MKFNVFGVRSCSCNKSDSDISALIMEKCMSYNNKSLCANHQFNNQRKSFNDIIPYQPQSEKRHRLSLNFNRQLHFETSLKPKKASIPTLIRKKYCPTQKSTSDYQPDKSQQLLQVKSKKMYTFINFHFSEDMSPKKPSTASTKKSNYFRMYCHRKCNQRLRNSFLCIDCHKIKSEIEETDIVNRNVVTPGKFTVKQLNEEKPKIIKITKPEIKEDVEKTLTKGSTNRRKVILMKVNNI